MKTKTGDYSSRDWAWPSGGRQGGKMMLRWVGAAVLDARNGFRRVRVGNPAKLVPASELALFSC